MENFSINITLLDLKTKLSFQIQAKDGDIYFKVARTFRDLGILRNLLIKGWPGTYIPPIPPQKWALSV